ncbi:LPS export ABC transporter permease LptG [Terrihabitans sp. B22-R8]|uniref:LPS export ABC transporter permease LptG n=1 Tax=Terrihabitans sp. B22-R8 TaxID=3425128 RepID=UPI00403CCF9A
MPLVLSLYIARKLLATILYVFAGIFVLITVIDFIELLRKNGDKADISSFQLVLIAVQRVPVISEQTLSFSVLFAAIIAFLLLSRKLELVVARASGFSVWQIIAPAVLVAGLIGVFATTVYNPASAFLKERANTQEASLKRGNAAALEGRRWIRQQSVDGQAVIRAGASSSRGTQLQDVTAFVFTSDGAFQERIEAASASLRDGYWQLEEARLLRVNVPPQSHRSYFLATNLSAEQVAESLTPVETVAFWELPEMIELSRHAGISALRLQMQYHALLARPALLATMVLIAACVSLGFVRSGGAPRAIMGGVGAGFVLYVLGKIAEDFGGAGFILPVVAAWTPVAVGACVSVTVLLFREDG